LKVLFLYNTSRGVDGMPALAIYDLPHTYDFGLKGLPLKITDRDVEGKPVPGIAYNTHICSMQGSFQKYT
jgi:hypothetical protein